MWAWSRKGHTISRQQLNGTGYSAVRVSLAEVTRFFALDTTSRLRPLYAGVITWVKHHYKCKLFLCVFGDVKVYAKSIYDVDVFAAIGWI